MNSLQIKWSTALTDLNWSRTSQLGVWCRLLLTFRLSLIFQHCWLQRTSQCTKRLVSSIKDEFAE